MQIVIIIHYSPCHLVTDADKAEIVFGPTDVSDPRLVQLDRPIKLSSGSSFPHLKYIKPMTSSVELKIKADVINIRVSNPDMLE